MQDGDEPDAAGPPEAGARFALIVQGAAPWAGVVEGIEGVQEALRRILLADPERAVLAEVAATLAALEEPAAWQVHGAGDGRPFWHFWLGFEGGSVTVQRLTAPLPTDQALGRMRALLREVAGRLAEQAGDLRRLGGSGAAGYVFGRRRTEP